MLPDPKTAAAEQVTDQIMDKEAEKEEFEEPTSGGMPAIQDNYVAGGAQFEVEPHEEGGITDQEIIDQFKMERAGTFAVQKDDLRDRIIRTLNLYNDVREKAAAKDPNFVSNVIQNPFV